MKYLILALALVAGVAHADGVPLLSARQEVAADRAQIAKLKTGTTATPVNVNRYALDANVITVALEGKEYRFVGTKTVRTLLDESDGKSTVVKVDSWQGTTPSGLTLALSRSQGGSSVMGTVGSPGFQHYELENNLLIRHSSISKAVTK